MTCAKVKNIQQQKNGKFPAKLAEEIPWNKLCVDLIGPYKIRIKGRDNIILKAVTMIDPVTGWFERTQYIDKKAMVIANLVKTGLIYIASENLVRPRRGITRSRVKT